MAERRMIAKTIIDSDAFLTMPLSSQALYFHLSMRGDDDGFINKPKSIMKLIGSNEDDIKILITKKFVIPFESGIVVIKHWRIHNYIAKDRYTPTKYQQEKSMLAYDENYAYTMPKSIETPTMYTTCIQNVDTGKVRLGKDSIGKIKSRAFCPPSIEDVIAYCQERDNKINPDNFIDFYASKNWMVGKNKMTDWKACIRTWESREQKKSSNPFKDLLRKEIDEQTRGNSLDDGNKSDFSRLLSGERLGK